MLNRGNGRRSKRVTRIDLVDESLDKRIFSSKRTVGKKVIKRVHFLLKREPQFYLDCGSITHPNKFIRLTKSDQVVGYIKNGELEPERPSDADKLFYLSKLDLRPHTESEPQDSPLSAEDVSTPDDDSASYGTCKSPSTTSSGSANG